MERTAGPHELRRGGPASWVHTNALYRLTEQSLERLKGCSADMCSTSWLPHTGGAAGTFSTYR